MSDLTETTITHSSDFQGITIWLGDGAPCEVEDAARPVDVRDWISSPIQRATTVARLRAIADMLDDSNPANFLADQQRSVAQP